MSDENQESLTPFASRKFILSLVSLTLMTGLPVLYKFLEISDTITLTVLGATSAIVSAYLGFNVLQKHIEG